MARTILIMAGGTGGHVFPALAVGEEMRGRGWNVVWLGAEGGMETSLVPRHGFALETIRFRGVRGKGLLRWALLPLALLVAFWQSAQVIFRVRPDVVLGMGGFAAFPGGMMASFLQRPFLIHEQNAIPGLANRVLAQVADRVYAAFPEALRKARWSGNPVRAEIAAVPPPAERFAGRSGPLRLLVVGGSLGAQALNASVPKALALLPEAERPRVIHQAGVKHIDALRQHYREAGVGGELVPFIEDMARHYADADLVVCRAGATTIAELACAGVASVLVPFPFATDDHQTANARFLAAHGAALLVPQSGLTPERLAELLRSLDRAHLSEMATKARALAKPDAAQVVADGCVELAR
ncbi:MAG TPA: undecaprenyldiphospho-muramoylpentapeptide beta-N-acetylglucosaminyltransferase [Burkholderiales bacterium]|nr:undecaprenyldiphospho-muramoylpentapeptide beta-N-acetylglucosaminyltransferase [Burkholderiales bacterium]